MPDTPALKGVAAQEVGGGDRVDGAGGLAADTFTGLDGEDAVASGGQATAGGHFHARAIDGVEAEALFGAAVGYLERVAGDGDAGDIQRATHSACSSFARLTG